MRQFSPFSVVFDDGEVFLLDERDAAVPARPKRKQPTAAEVMELIGCDAVSKRAGVFTARQGFFYRHGKTSEDLVTTVEVMLTAADWVINVEDSGDVDRPFKGGAGVAANSHWYVRFTLTRKESE